MEQVRELSLEFKLLSVSYCGIGRFETARFLNDMFHNRAHRSRFPYSPEPSSAKLQQGSCGEATPLRH